MAKSHIRLGRKDILDIAANSSAPLLESLGEAYRSLTGRGDRRAVLHLLQCEQTSGCHFPNGPGLLIIGHDNSSLGGIADGVAINVTYVAYLTVTDSTAIRSVGLDTLNRGRFTTKLLLPTNPTTPPMLLLLDSIRSIQLSQLMTLRACATAPATPPTVLRISSRQRQGSFRRGWRVTMTPVFIPEMPPMRRLHPFRQSSSIGSAVNQSVVGSGHSAKILE